MTGLSQFQRVLVVEVELVITVACAVYSDFVESVDHLVAFFDVGESRRREAIPRKEGYGLWIFLPELVDLGLEIANSHGAALWLQVVDIIEMDDG